MAGLAFMIARVPADHLGDVVWVAADMRGQRSRQIVQSLPQQVGLEFQCSGFRPRGGDRDLHEAWQHRRDFETLIVAVEVIGVGELLQIGMDGRERTHQIAQHPFDVLIQLGELQIPASRRGVQQENRCRAEPLPWPLP